MKCFDHHDIVQYSPKLQLDGKIHKDYLKLSACSLKSRQQNVISLVQLLNIYYCLCWCKREGLGVHALSNWKNTTTRCSIATNFCWKNRVDVRIDKHPPRWSVKSLEGKKREYTVNISLVWLQKQQITIICKIHYMEVFKNKLDSRPRSSPAQLQKTNFFLNTLLLLLNSISDCSCELRIFYWLSKDAQSWVISNKIRKAPRGIRGEKSRKDTASSGKLISTIGW